MILGCIKVGKDCTDCKHKVYSMCLKEMKYPFKPTYFCIKYKTGGIKYEQ